MLQNTIKDGAIEDMELQNLNATATSRRAMKLLAGVSV